MRYHTNRMPARIGVYTQKIVKPVFKARGLMEGKIITHWVQIVGEKFACLALPEKITFPKGKTTEGTLHLMVTSSGSLFLHYAQDLILEQVNTFFGYKALTKLRMTHGFIPPEEKHRHTTVEPSAEDLTWLGDQIKSLVDPELKERLEKLGLAVIIS
jgi:hypothetical protein